MNWLAEIIEVLKNPKFPQIMGELEKFDDEGEIEGKCALGELRCAKGVKSEDICDSGGEIMESFKVPKEFRTGYVLPKLQTEWVGVGTGDYHGVFEKVDFDNDSNIQSWIYQLNDIGFTYDQIVEFLEVTFGQME